MSTLMEVITYAPKMTPLNHPQLNRQVPIRHLKAWGWEDCIVNNDFYCAKILHFNQGAQFSFHFHVEKHETWYVFKGKFLLIHINTRIGLEQQAELVPGDVVVIPPGSPHKLIAVEESEIFEASTPHRESDSYRIAPGDSQTNEPGITLNENRV